MVKSFLCRETKKLHEGKSSRKFKSIERQAQRKLAMLEAATGLMDLKSPPGNRLEALKGNRKGQHSIRINNQYRMCFVWEEGNAHEVEIVDYHD